MDRTEVRFDNVFLDAFNDVSPVAYIINYRLKELLWKIKLKRIDRDRLTI